MEGRRGDLQFRAWITSSDVTIEVVGTPAFTATRYEEPIVIQSYLKNQSKNLYSACVVLSTHMNIHYSHSIMHSCFFFSFFLTIIAILLSNVSKQLKLFIYRVSLKKRSAIKRNYLIEQLKFNEL